MSNRGRLFRRRFSPPRSLGYTGRYVAKLLTVTTSLGAIWRNNARLALALSRAGVAIEPMFAALAMAVLGAGGIAVGAALAGAVSGLLNAGVVCLYILARVCLVSSVA